MTNPALAPICSALTLPDGYNGSTVALDTTRIIDAIPTIDRATKAIVGYTVKLSEVGKPYMIRWAHLTDEPCVKCGRSVETHIIRS